MVIGFTSVVGDLFHPGHIAMIQECADQCDYLIVGLICDPTDRPQKNRPIESVFERWFRVAHCEGVDEVIPLEGEADLALALEMLDYDVRFVGEEYKDKYFTGKNWWYIQYLGDEGQHVRADGLIPQELQRIGNMIVRGFTAGEILPGAYDGEDGEQA